MLYKFKSRATADVIMLEPNGRQLLEIMGKSPDAHGIVTAAQIPGAIQALEAAVAADEANGRPQAAAGANDEDGDAQEPSQAVRLRQRAAPLIDMMRRSAAEGFDVTW